MRQQDILLADSSHTFFGTHILAEIYGVAKEKLDDIELLMGSIKMGVELSGATLCEISFKQFDPQGCSIVALLSESHVSIHTYPEIGSAFVDAFTCGTRCEPKKIIEQLEADLNATHIEAKEIKRGQVVA